MMAGKALGEGAVSGGGNEGRIIGSQVMVTSDSRMSLRQLLTSSHQSILIPVAPRIPAPINPFAPWLLLSPTHTPARA